jgi:hypothetical protein
MSQPLDLSDTKRITSSIRPVPAYLRLHCWRAHIHPAAARPFEPRWLITR